MKKGKTFFRLLGVCLIFVPGFLVAENNGSLRIGKAFDALGNDISGDRQIGVVSTALDKPFLVTVRDEKRRPAENAAVIFRVLNDTSAVCEPETTFTDQNGNARAKIVGGIKTGEFILEATLRDDLSKRVLLSYHIYTKRWISLLIMQLVGGFAIFFFGFKVAGKGLTKSVGGGLRELLYRFTSNRFLGMISGMFISFLLQSSTATNVMLVGFVTGGLISLIGALTVGLGAALGTAMTVQLIAFKIYQYSLVIIAIGFFLNSLKKPVRYYGQFILGFGLVFLGIKIMGEAFMPLSLSGAIEGFFVAFKGHPNIVFLVSALFAAAIHSSAATIGIMVTLSFQGIIGLEHAFPVIIGANLGVSATALLASIRGSREAKMCALGVFLYKAVGVLIFLPFLGFWVGMLGKTAATASRQIANSHAFINIVLVGIFLPLVRPLERMLRRIVPKERKELRRGARFLDRSIITNPAAAIAHAHREILRMSDMVLEMFKKSISVFKENDKDLMRDLIKKDDEIDELEEEINDYLTHISQEELTDYQSKRIASLFFITDELEHIGDIVSKSLMVYAGKKIQQGFMFSNEGFAEIHEYHKKIEESLELALSALTTYDRGLAERVKDERKLGVEKHITLHNAHIERLKRGLQESIETSTIHLDLINDLERIHFHISNIGFAILGKISGRA